MARTKATAPATYSYFNPFAALRQILFNTEFIMAQLDDLNQAEQDAAAAEQAAAARVKASLDALNAEIAQLQAQASPDLAPNIQRMQDLVAALQGVDPAA